MKLIGGEMMMKTMNMIHEDYVSFETAKLLKERGFDWVESPFYSEQDRDEWRRNAWYSIPNPRYDENIPFDSPTLYVTAPHISIQTAMKWMREVHNILLVVDYEYECTDTSYYYKIYRLGENGKPERCAVKGEHYDRETNKMVEDIVGYRDYERGYSDYGTYEEACDAGIKYCLENLAK